MCSVFANLELRGTGNDRGANESEMPLVDPYSVTPRTQVACQRTAVGRASEDNLLSLVDTSRRHVRNLAVSAPSADRAGMRQSLAGCSK